jgi:hypothetical protein
MSKNTYPLKLPTSVKKAAAELAATEGVSLNQFIAAAVAEKVGSLRAADDFLRERAGNPRICSSICAAHRRLHRARTTCHRGSCGRFKFDRHLSPYSVGKISNFRSRGGSDDAENPDVER